jgi:hypothetical protein
MLFWLLSYYYLVHCGHGKLIPKRLLHIGREIRGHERNNERSERGLGGRTTRAQYAHRQPGVTICMAVRCMTHYTTIDNHARTDTQCMRC